MQNYNTIQNTIFTQTGKYTQDANFITKLMPFADYTDNKFAAQYLLANQLISDRVPLNEQEYKTSNPTEIAMNAGYANKKIIWGSSYGGNLAPSGSVNGTQLNFNSAIALQYKNPKIRANNTANSEYTDGSPIMTISVGVGKVVYLYTLASALMDVKSVNPALPQAILSMLSPLGANQNWSGASSIATITDPQTRMGFGFTTSMSNDKVHEYLESTYAQIGEPTVKMQHAQAFRASIYFRSVNKILSTGLSKCNTINTTLNSIFGDYQWLTEKMSPCETFNPSSSLANSPQNVAILNYKWSLNPSAKSDAINFLKFKGLGHILNESKENVLPTILTSCGNLVTLTAIYMNDKRFVMENGENRQAKIDKGEYMNNLYGVQYYGLTNPLEIAAAPHGGNANYKSLDDFVFTDATYQSYLATLLRDANALLTVGTSTGARPATLPSLYPVGRVQPWYVVQKNSSGTSPRVATPPNTNGVTMNYTPDGLMSFVPNIAILLATMTLSPLKNADNSITQYPIQATYNAAPKITIVKPRINKYGKVNNVIGGNTADSIPSFLNLNQMNLGADPITTPYFNSISTTGERTFDTNANSRATNKNSNMKTFRSFVLDGFFDNHKPSNFSSITSPMNGNGIMADVTATLPVTLNDFSGGALIGLTHSARVGININSLLNPNEAQLDFLTQTPSDLQSSGMTLYYMMGHRPVDCYKGGNNTSEYAVTNWTQKFYDILFTDPTQARNTSGFSILAEMAIGQNITPGATQPSKTTSGLILQRVFYETVIAKGTEVQINRLAGYYSTTTGMLVNTPQIDTISDNVQAVQSNRFDCIGGTIPSDIVLQVAALARQPLLPPAYTAGNVEQNPFFPNPVIISGTLLTDPALPDGTVKSSLTSPNSVNSIGFTQNSGSYGAYSCIEILNAQGLASPWFSAGGGTTNWIRGMTVNVLNGIATMRASVLFNIRMILSIPILDTFFGKTNEDIMGDNMYSNIKIRTGQSDNDIDPNTLPIFIKNKWYTNSIPKLSGESEPKGGTVMAGTWQASNSYNYSDNKGDYWRYYPISSDSTYQRKGTSIDIIDSKRLLDIAPDFYFNTSVTSLITGNGFIVDPSVMPFPSQNVNVNNNGNNYAMNPTNPNQIQPLMNGGLFGTTNIGSTTATPTYTATTQYCAIIENTLKLELVAPAQKNLTCYKGDIKSGRSGAALINVTQPLGGNDSKTIIAPESRVLGADNILQDDYGFPDELKLPVNIRASNSSVGRLVGGSTLSTIADTTSFSYNVSMIASDGGRPIVFLGFSEELDYSTVANGQGGNPMVALDRIILGTIGTASDFYSFDEFKKHVLNDFKYNSSLIKHYKMVSQTIEENPDNQDAKEKKDNLERLLLELYDAASAYSKRKIGSGEYNPNITTYSMLTYIEFVKIINKGREIEAKNIKIDSQNDKLRYKEIFDLVNFYTTDYDNQKIIDDMMEKDDTCIIIPKEACIYDKLAHLYYLFYKKKIDPKSILYTKLNQIIADPTKDTAELDKYGNVLSNNSREIIHNSDTIETIEAKIAQIMGNKKGEKDTNNDLKTIEQQNKEAEDDKVNQAIQSSKKSNKV